MIFLVKVIVTRIQEIFKFINLKNVWPKPINLVFATIAISAVTSCNTHQQKHSRNLVFLNNSVQDITETYQTLEQEEILNNQNLENSPMEIIEAKKIISLSVGEKSDKKEELFITLRTRDNIERKGVLSLCQNNPKGNIILCHPASYEKGFMENFDRQVFKDYHCLRFDFRRHGENNKKQYSTLGKHEIYDVEAAIEIIKNHPKTQNLPTYGFGISLGAAVLIEAENKFDFFDALILQSSFESLRKQIKRTYKFYDLPLMHNLIFREPTRFIAKKKYRLKLYKVSPVESISNINKPIFLIHAKNDNYISFEAFEALYRAGRKSIAKIWTPEGGFHTKIFNTYPQEYTKHCNDFLAKITQYRTLLKMPS